MSTRALASVQPDQTDITAAVAALPHVTDYLDSHHDPVLRLVVDSESH